MHMFGTVKTVVCKVNPPSPYSQPLCHTPSEALGLPQDLRAQMGHYCAGRLSAQAHHLSMTSLPESVC